MGEIIVHIQDLGTVTVVIIVIAFFARACNLPRTPPPPEINRGDDVEAYLGRVRAIY
jgi:hypothetical protein